MNLTCCMILFRKNSDKNKGCYQKLQLCVEFFHPIYVWFNLLSYPYIYIWLPWGCVCMEGIHMIYVVNRLRVRCTMQRREISHRAAMPQLKACVFFKHVVPSIAALFWFLKTKQKNEERNTM